MPSEFKSLWVIIGYMGSGKSTVGKALSSSLNSTFLDLDEEIEREEGMDIPGIFSSRGELYFRRKESEVLEQCLSGFEGMRVLSVGGGTPCYASNMDKILDATPLVFYLRYPPVELARRLEAESDRRPLISGLEGEELTEFIAKHLFERQAFYNRARYVIDAPGKTVDELVKEILSRAGYA